MPTPLFDDLLARTCVYQDLVVDGRIVHPGACDCEGRWKLIAPRLIGAQTVLDVGSNFGWFGQRIVEAEPRAVVASLEADEHSALVQRAVLEANGQHRIALLTRPARQRRLAAWHAAGQRFDAALCLNVLHWMRDGVEFLETLGRVAGRIVVELPHPDEVQAGIRSVRRELGAAESLLARLFPTARREKLGEVASHLHADCSREVWLVETGQTQSEQVTPGISLGTLMSGGLSWPARPWWLEQVDGALARSGSPDDEPAPGWRTAMFTPAGLTTAGMSRAALLQTRRALFSVPVAGIIRPRLRAVRQLRRWASRLLWSVRVF